MLAVIGGSGLYSLEGLTVEDRRMIETPFGYPSGEVVTGRIGDSPALFINRHGEDHSIAPHQVNYRANLKALAEAGATRVLAISTVGGITAGYEPGVLAVPDQIVDYTWGREHTLSEPGGPILHVDFTQPYAAAWRARVVDGLSAAGLKQGAVVDGGTFGVTQGPRLESAAEIRRMEGDGCDLVGMTGMPEAALARELGIDYATICPVANRAAGLSGETLDFDEMTVVLEACLAPMGSVAAQLA
ncbi:MAG: S-methyl-5'-thioinosine phosphorylase [Solirubrobacterales bacterium]|nr:S-methyl-5'-thioinosine phosphorylase [Solirubrobacterales bacterium]